MLGPQYLNQAHNDVAQLVIEGGALGLGLMLLGLVWFCRAGWRCWRAFRASDGSAGMGLFAWLSLATLLAASLVDYPLRTPSLMAVAALLACLVQWSAKGASRRVSPPAAKETIL